MASRSIYQTETVSWDELADVIHSRQYFVIPGNVVGVRSILSQLKQKTLFQMIVVLLSYLSNRMEANSGSFLIPKSRRRSRRAWKAWPMLTLVPARRWSDSRLAWRLWADNIFFFFIFLGVCDGVCVVLGAGWLFVLADSISLASVLGADSLDQIRSSRARLWKVETRSKARDCAWLQNQWYPSRYSHKYNIWLTL